MSSPPLPHILHTVVLQAHSQPRASPGLSSELLALLEARVDARFALLPAQYASLEVLREWEAR